jgi:hypothetical protein
VAAYWPAPAETPEDAFQRAPVDYPPVFPYVLWGIGRASSVFARGVIAQSRYLDFLIRVPVVLANGALAILIFAVLRQRAGEANAAMGAALFALNPAVVFDTAYWGQADALVALAVAAGLVVTPRRPEWGWALLAAATLVKPLAYPFLPLAAVHTVKHDGWRRTVKAAAAAAVAWSVLLLPFMVTGRFGDIALSLFHQLDAMPYVSVNAHNVWWIIGRGVPWTPSWERALGSLTYETLGLAAFGLFYLVLIASLWRSTHERALLLAAASTAFGFFVLATHMHENHLFIFLPLLLLAAGEQPGWRKFCVAISAVFLLNMALHDRLLSSLFDGLAPGPKVTLPPQMEPMPGLADYLRSEGYLEAAEQMSGRASALRLALTLVNSQACVLLFAYWVWSVGIGRGWTAVPDPRRVALSTAAVVVIAIVLCAMPFLIRLARAVEAGG